MMHLIGGFLIRRLRDVIAGHGTCRTSSTPPGGRGAPASRRGGPQGHLAVWVWGTSEGLAAAQGAINHSESEHFRGLRCISDGPVWPTYLEAKGSKRGVQGNGLWGEADILGHVTMGPGRFRGIWAKSSEHVGERAESGGIEAPTARLGHPYRMGHPLQE